MKVAGLPEGVRYVERDLLAINMAQGSWAGEWRGIAVTCVCCGRCDRLASRNQEVLRNMSDAEARRVFESHGWTVSPTRCPEHVGVE